MNFRVLLLVMVLLAGLALPLHAQENDADTLDWELINDGPVVAPGSADWNREFTEPGAVAYHDGRFHLFRTGFSPLDELDNGINYLHSADGITWEEPSSAKMISTDDLPFDARLVSATHVTVTEDAAGDPTWTLYFITNDTADWPPNGGGVGMATASAPAGPWTFHPTHVFTPSDGDGFDNRAIRDISVIEFEGRSMMYYGAFDQRGRETIGLAISDDGLTWERYSEEPILDVSQDWETVDVLSPNVIAIEEGLLMFYVSRSGVGVAFSADGLAWTKWDANPLFLNWQLNLARSTYSTLAVAEGQVNLFVENANPSGGTAAWLVRSKAIDLAQYVPTD